MVEATTTKALDVRGERKVAVKLDPQTGDYYYFLLVMARYAASYQISRY